MLHQFRSFSKYLKLLLLLPVFIFTISIFLHKDSAILQDLGRHLVLGNIIYEEKSIPSTNIFSYTYPDFPFLNHHWGSEVIFYLINKAFSVNGLIWLKLLLIVISVNILILFSAKRSDSIALLISSTLALEILRERTEIRPEIFAFSFFSIFLVILYKEKEKEGKWIWLLPLFSFFWVNLHISFIFGLAIYFLFLIDRLITRKIKIKYLILGLILIASLLVNPSGIKGALYPFTIFGEYGYPIIENQSPFFLDKLMDNPTIFYFKISFLILLLATPLLFLNKYFFETTMVFLTGILSFAAIRNFPFFALASILPISLGLTLAKIKVISFWKIEQNNRSWIIISIYLLIIGFVSWEIFSLLSNNYYLRQKLPIRSGFGQITGMKNAVDFFLKYNFEGQIFNNFDIGSYLIYRLYPKKKVFIDGRPEAYPADFIQKIYIPIQKDDEIWREEDKKYSFQTIIFGYTDATPWGRQFLSRIVKDPDWSIVFFDDYGIILVKQDQLAKNEKIKDLGKQLNSYGLARIQETNQPDALYRLADLYNLLGLADLESSALIKAKR